MNEKIGIDELKLLQRYAEAVRKDGELYYYIFSKGDFTQKFQEVSK